MCFIDSTRVGGQSSGASLSVLAAHVQNQMKPYTPRWQRRCRATDSELWACCFLSHSPLNFPSQPHPSEIIKSKESCVCMLSCFSRVWLFATPRTVARQAPLSMGFSRQEHWNGLPCPPPGHLTNPGIKPASLRSPALAGEGSLPLAPPGKPKGSWAFCKCGLGH